jgi:hypothetical protein
MHESWRARRVLKLLSEDPTNYKDAPREGIRRVLEEVMGRELPRDTPLDTSRIASIRMGTTVRLLPGTLGISDMRGANMLFTVASPEPCRGARSALGLACGCHAQGLWHECFCRRSMQY